MVVTVHQIAGDSRWALEYEKHPNADHGWRCPECRHLYRWDETWDYAIRDGSPNIDTVCLDCAHQLGWIW